MTDPHPRLRFEPIESEHHDDLLSWLTSDTWPFHGTRNPSEEKVGKWIADGQFGSDDDRGFWILESSDRVGIVVLHELTDPTPVFDLRLSTAARGRGLGRSVLGWLAEHVFTRCGKHRLEGHTRVDNRAMRRAFRAAGWVKEAHHRRAWPDEEGEFHDAITYALLKEDWERGTTTPVPWNDEP